MTQIELANLALDKLGEPPLTALNDVSGPAQAIARNYQPTLSALTRKYRWNFARKSAVLEPVWVAATNTLYSSADTLRINKVAHGLTVGQAVLVSVEDYPSANGTFFITNATDPDYFLLEVVGLLNSSSTIGEYHVAPQHTWAYRIALPADCLTLRSVNGYEANRPHEFFTREGEYIFTNCESIDVIYTRKMVAGTDEAKFDDTFNQCFATMLAADIAMPVTGAMSRRNDMVALYEQEIAAALMSNVFERRDPNIDRLSGTSFLTRIYGE